jgi:stage V sporulation protein B
LAALRRQVRFTILGRKWPGFLVSASVAYAAGFGLELLTHQAVQPFGVRFNHLIGAMAVGIVVFVLYVALLGLTRVVAADDIARLPAPLQNMLRRGRKPSAAGDGK